MKTITLAGPSGKKHKFKCNNVIDGTAINPVLPQNFDDTPNGKRGDRSMAWWDVPFIQAICNGELVDSSLAEAFEVRCLDGGAWDRSTWMGCYTTLEKALAAAHHHRLLYKKYEKRYFVAGLGLFRTLEEAQAAMQLAGQSMLHIENLLSNDPASYTYPRRG